MMVCLTGISTVLVVSDGMSDWYTVLVVSDGMSDWYQYCPCC